MVLLHNAAGLVKDWPTENTNMYKYKVVHTVDCTLKNKPTFSAHQPTLASSSATTRLKMYHSPSNIKVRHHSTMQCAAQQKLPEHYHYPVNGNITYCIPKNVPLTFVGTTMPIHTCDITKLLAISEVLGRLGFSSIFNII